MNKNYKEIVSKVFYVSRLSKSTNKKIATFNVVLLANISAFLDIVIILTIADIFSDNLSKNKFIIDYLNFYNSNKYILIIVIFLRFSTLLFQKIYTKKIELIVDNDIKNHLVEEVFEKNNFSISDSLFFVNVLSQHISFFYSSFINFLVISTQSAAYMLYLLLTNPEFLGYMFLLLLFLYFPIKILFNLARKSMHESYNASKEANNFIQNIIENIFLIKLYNKGKHEIEKINKSLNERRNFLYKNEIYGSLTAILPSFLVFLLFSIFALSERILRIVTIDFLGIILRLFQSVSSMASTFSRIINSYVHIEELEKIDRNKQIIKSENFINSPSNDSEIIEVENVFFKYFNSDFGTFENVSFKINKNKHYIISGANGAGKSTLLALIAGVLIPESGRITNRAKKIGYVGPTPLIIDGTLKENILYGNLEVHSDRKLLDLINELSLFDNDDDADLNMKISNKSLSSGQMQKISFLRIFLSDIDLLILDESTSNLDSNSKNKIVEKISNLKNVTILNSTHEPELFSFYDKKILIDIKENERKVIID